MAKFYGPIGFVVSTETEDGSGIWEDIVVERNYRGDVSKNVERWDGGEHLNSNLNIRNVISIVADPYASSKLFAIRYVKWLGEYWEVVTAEVTPPRITLTIGGVYNGPKAEPSGTFGEHPRFE